MAFTSFVDGAETRFFGEATPTSGAVNRGPKSEHNVFVVTTPEGAWRLRRHEGKPLWDGKLIGSELSFDRKLVGMTLRALLAETRSCPS